MHYSVAVKFNNQEDRMFMKVFLDNNKKIIENIQLMYPELSWDSTSYFGEDLKYVVKQDCLLGFKATTMQDYIWHLCVYITVQAQKDYPNSMFFYCNERKIRVGFEKSGDVDIVVDSNGFVNGMKEVVWFQELHNNWLVFSDCVDKLKIHEKKQKLKYKSEKSK